VRLVPLLILLIAAPAAAKRAAAPIATASADVDGDGRADQIRVVPGGVEVQLAGRKDAAWKPFAATGTVLSATISVGGGKRPMIAVTAVFERGQEAVVLRWSKGGLDEVWRGDVGPHGRDADYEVIVRADAKAVWRSQRRRGIERCDGVGRLFVEAWDDGAREFRPAAPEIGVDKTAPVLRATRTAPANAPATSVTYRAAAVSTEAGAGDAAQLGSPRELDDGNPATVWREDRGGDGRGEFVTFRARKRGVKLAALRIVPGDARSAKEFAGANRLARVAVVTADRAFWIDLPDERPRDDAAAAAPYWVVLDPPIATDCVSVVFAGWHAGKGAKGGGTSAIADLAALGEDDLAVGGGDAKLVDAVIAGGLEGDTAGKQLARRGAAAARAIEARLGGTVAGDAQLRLWRVLAAIRDPGSAAELGRGLAAPGIDGDDAAVLAAALGAVGEPGQEQLARIVAAPEAAEAARAAAAAHLGEGRRDALVAALGPGPRALRKAIAIRLADAGVAWLLAQVSQAATDGATAREADLWRAVGLAAARGAADERGKAIDALARRAAEITDYERRYRIAGALAALPEPAATDAARALAKGLGNDGEAAAVRQVLAAGLARSRSPGAAPLLAELATDRDPGVRLAALRALAGRDDLGGGAWGGRGETAGRDAVDRVLIGALDGDRWPEVRQTAAAALALACPRRGPTAALEDAAETDDDVTVRGDALAALVACHAPKIAARLLGIAKDAKAPTALRERAVDLIGALEDPANAAALIEALRKWRGAAFSEQAGLELAQRAAATVGRLGGVAQAKGDKKTVAAARAALLDAAADPAFFEIQAAAATGLGALGAGCDREARRMLEELTRSDQQAVQTAARHALTRCGK